MASVSTFGLKISREDLGLFKRLKAQSNNISDLIETFNKQKKRSGRLTKTVTGYNRLTLS